MTSYRLVVLTPNQRTFDEHFGGDGRVVYQDEVDSPGVFFGIVTGVDYGETDMARYRNRSVRLRYKPGEASPVKFVNC